MTRPKNNNELVWKGWHRSASESLLHATVDDNAECVLDFSRQAIEAGREALTVADNPRQAIMTEALLDAAHRIKDIAEKTPEEL